VEMKTAVSAAKIATPAPINAAGGVFFGAVASSGLLSSLKFDSRDVPLREYRLEWRRNEGPACKQQQPGFTVGAEEHQGAASIAGIETDGL
jgi:hypothetical protein